MEMEKEYYIGYLRNPKDTIVNGFQEVPEVEVILEKDYNDFREVALRSKVYIMDKNEVFDGHKLYKNHAGLIGRIGKKLTIKEADKMITEIRENKMTEYIDKLTKLINDTREMYLKGERDYQDERAKFAGNFEVDLKSVSDNPTYKSLH